VVRLGRPARPADQDDEGDLDGADLLAYGGRDRTRCQQDQRQRAE
jgi:hypothetical protein